MFKFIKKEHYKKEDHRGKIIITYSLSEIILGLLLLVLSIFHAYNLAKGGFAKSNSNNIRYQTNNLVK